MENNQINYVTKKGTHIPKDVKEYILKKLKKVVSQYQNFQKNMVLVDPLFTRCLEMIQAVLLTRNYLDFKKKTHFSNN